MRDHQPEAQWRALWERIKAQGDAYPPYHDLTQRLAEPHRAYHTLRHILHCLDEMGRVRHLAAHPDAMAMALWYHDAIYDTHAADNGEQSAALAAQILQGAAVSETFVQKVACRTRATKDHTGAEALDTRPLVDSD